MYQARFKEITLKFGFPAGTSRGVLYEKKSWFLILQDNQHYGIGECSLIPGLSPDNSECCISKIDELCRFINEGKDPGEFDLSGYPSISFGLETALSDLRNQGTKILFPSLFTLGKEGIDINGLIWMGSETFMIDQIKNKTQSGFSCLKLKIGAIDFESEVNLIKKVRNEFPDLEIRLDANGAFAVSDALAKIEILSKYTIHSLEQPVRPGNWKSIAEICSKSPIPIALDEELIGIYDYPEKEKMLRLINPKYIILKPGLLGGLKASAEWIGLAAENGTGWWVTSALESNIGLNAIAQWTCTLGNKMVQGLGTGQIYENNIPSPLTIREGKLFYDTGKNWDTKDILE